MNPKPSPFGKATDLWRVGIIDAPIARVLAEQNHAQLPIHWLPDLGSYRYIADPFGHRAADGTLTLFAEAYDYRTKHGEIQYFELDSEYQVRRSGRALRLPVHISYPHIIEDQGEIYMLPEAYRTGKLTLYRAGRFPDQWEVVCDLLDSPAIDASVIRFQERWWMFYALPGENLRALNELHIAYADHLTGPWHLHPMNPVRTGRDASRMGGTPFIHDGQLHLPMQDCEHTYGGASVILRVDALSTTRIETSITHRLTSDAFSSAYPDGMHTLSACGDVTLIDVKRICHSPMRRVIDLERRARRLLGAEA